MMDGVVVLATVLVGEEDMTRSETFFTPKWGLLWHSKDRLDGVREHLIYENCVPMIFQRRSEARAYATQRYGYIKTRKDLRSEPCGWRLPIPVHVLGILWRR